MTCELACRGTRTPAKPGGVPCVLPPGTGDGRVRVFLRRSRHRRAQRSKRDVLEDLVDFTPMACGFKIKTGEVCTDMRALERFFAAEIVDTGEDVATVEELISDGGALNAELPCNEQVEAVTAMCQRLTRATPGQRHS